MHEKDWQDILSYSGFLFTIKDCVVSICDMETGTNYLSFDTDVSPLDLINYVNENGILISALTIEQIDNFPCDIYIKEKYDMQAALDLREILYTILDTVSAKALNVYNNAYPI